MCRWSRPIRSVSFISSLFGKSSSTATIVLSFHPPPPSLEYANGLTVVVWITTHREANRRRRVNHPRSLLPPLRSIKMFFRECSSEMKVSSLPPSTHSSVSPQFFSLPCFPLPLITATTTRQRPRLLPHRRGRPVRTPSVSREEAMGPDEEE